MSSTRGSRSARPDNGVLALLLLVLGILANDHHATLTANDLALFAHGLNGRSHFHLDCLLTAVGQDLLRQVIRPLVRS